MMRIKTFVVFFVLTMLVLTGRPAVHAEVCNRIVAIVNDDVITLYELEKKIKELTGKKVSDLENEDKEGFLEARRSILDLLIGEKIIQHKVKEAGFEASEKELESSIERIKMDNQWTQEDLVAEIQSQGGTFYDFKNQIKQDIGRNRLIDYEVKSKIIISDEAIKKYYDDHRDDFTYEEGVQLAIIFLPMGSSPPAPQQAEKIISLLNDGVDFGELATQYSKGPNAENGGDLGMIKLSQLDPKLKSIIDGMAVGEVSQPIVVSTGIQLIKLINKQEQGDGSFEMNKDSIYNLLYNKEVREFFSAWIKDLKEKAYIKIIF